MHRHTDTRTDTDTDTHTDIDTQTQTHTHRHTHRHTQTHRHTPPPHTHTRRKNGGAEDGVGAEGRMMATTERNRSKKGFLKASLVWSESFAWFFDAWWKQEKKNLSPWCVLSCSSVVCCPTVRPFCLSVVVDIVALRLLHLILLLHYSSGGQRPWWEFAYVTA